MLRSWQPQEFELIKFCHLQRWDLVSDRCGTHPLEAAPSDASLRGEGSTVLALAIRKGAPLVSLIALLHASIDQITVVHRMRGSVLHEAIKHGHSTKVLSHLLRVMSHHRQSKMGMHHRPDQSSLADASQFTHVEIQEKRIIQGSDILQAQDDMGKTALHLLMECLGDRSSEIKRCPDDRLLFTRAFMSACPQAIQKIDCNGNTPLLLLLQMPRDQRSSATESLIFSVVDFILSFCPEAANVRQMGSNRKRHRYLPPAIGENSVACVEIARTPLYYALLHGRSLETILLLIKQNQSLGGSPCSAVVTLHHEVPLHIAISTRAPLSIIYHVAAESPEVILSEDIFGLNSLDWLWIRHVLDWHASPLDVSSSRIVSRRRLVDTQYSDWHTLASNNIPLNDDVSVPINPIAIRGLQEDLLHRMKLLLPPAASVLSQDFPYDQKEHWSLIHAACHVSCPIAMVRAALFMSEETLDSIKTKDMRAGRLPLHYAAGRWGYSATVPVGATRSIQLIREQSPVFDVVAAYPQACFEIDLQGQLPFHIAIDTANRTRASLLGEQLQSEIDLEENAILSLLLMHNPGALDHRDGITNLYPWQQAAVGYGSSLNTVYTLLKLQPTRLWRS